MNHTGPTSLLPLMNKNRQPSLEDSKLQREKEQSQVISTWLLHVLALPGWTVHWRFGHFLLLLSGHNRKWGQNLWALSKNWLKYLAELCLPRPHPHRGWTGSECPVEAKTEQRGAFSSCRAPGDPWGDKFGEQQPREGGWGPSSDALQSSLTAD